MISPAKDVADLIVDAGLSTFGTDLFVGAKPTSPDALVATFNTGGDAPETGSNLERPTVMVHVRGESDGYVATYSKAKDILDALHRTHDFVKNNSRYLAIYATSDILQLGNDEKGRPLFSINFRMIRTSN